MKNKFCLPIVETTTQAILKTINNHKDKYTYFEIWLDYIEDLTTENLDKVCNLIGANSIFLFRRQNLEIPHMAQYLKESCYQWLSTKECYVDFDASTQAEDLEQYLKNKGQSKLIASYHNYSSTPSEMQLGEIAEKMHAHDPDIYKFSTFCEAKTDAFRLLELQQALIEREKKHVVLGMGENGVITRVFCNLWGNEFWFAPYELDKATAEGQLSYDQLKQLLDGLS